MTDFRKLLDTLESFNNDELMEVNDSFDLEINDELLIETGIVGFTEDGVILEADDKVLELLSKHKMISESFLPSPEKPARLKDLMANLSMDELQQAISNDTYGPEVRDWLMFKAEELVDERNLKYDWYYKPREMMEILFKYLQGGLYSTIHESNQEFTDWSKYDEPTVDRIKQGKTPPVDRTDYDLPPGMRNDVKGKTGPELRREKLKKMGSLPAYPKIPGGMRTVGGKIKGPGAIDVRVGSKVVERTIDKDVAEGRLGKSSVPGKQSNVLSKTLAQIKKMLSDGEWEAEDDIKNVKPGSHVTLRSTKTKEKKAYLIKESVAEGSDYTPPKLGTVKANLMHAKEPTVQVQVFKHNTLRGDSYWVTKEVKRFKTMDQARAYIDRINKQGVAEGQPGMSPTDSDSLAEIKHLSGLREGSREGVISSVTNRILRQHVDLLSTYGPEKVLAAIEDQAEGLDDLEEIGSSDVSIWVDQVRKSLERGAYDHLKENNSSDEARKRKILDMIKMQKAMGNDKAVAELEGILKKEFPEVEMALENKDKDEHSLNVGVEAYGVRGMNSKPWRKTFKSQQSFEQWLEQTAGDVEVQGTREVNLNDMFKEGKAEKSKLDLARTLYAQTYAKNAKTVNQAKEAEKTAYAAVEKKYGSEVLSALKKHHSSNRQGVAEGEQIDEISYHYRGKKSKPQYGSDEWLQSVGLKPEDSKSTAKPKAKETPVKDPAIARNQKARASHWSKTGVSPETIKWMRDNDMLESHNPLSGHKEDVQQVDEAEYQGRKVALGKPMQGDVAKFKVYVKKPDGKVVKVNFGDKNMRIKKSNPARRKSFRARHRCDNPGPRWKARYWSCRKW